MNSLQKREEAVMRALRGVGMVPIIKTKDSKEREKFGREAIAFLEEILRNVDFSECVIPSDAGNVLRIALRPRFRVKRWKRYAYIADRMIKRLVHVLITEGEKGLEDDG